VKTPIKKERIFRALSIKEGISISRLAKDTSLAKSYVYKVIKELEREDAVWITEKIYVNHDKFIRKWGQLKKTIFQKTSPLIIDILIPERVRKIIKDYAISGPFAELLIQGESPGRPLIIYIDEKDFIKVKDKLLQLGRTGIGSTWIYPYDPDILKTSWMLKGWKVVSIPQLAADIIALGTYADLGYRLYKRWLSASKRI